MGRSIRLKKMPFVEVLVRRLESKASESQYIVVVLLKTISQYETAMAHLRRERLNL